MTAQANALATLSLTASGGRSPFTAIYLRAVVISH